MYSKKISAAAGNRRGRGGSLASSLNSSRNSSREQLTRPTNDHTGQRHKQNQVQAVKSADITRIEQLLEAVQQGSDTKHTKKPECYCMGNKHKLSPYTPICNNCGLILCELHSPAAMCPFCHATLLSPTERSAIVARLIVERDEAVRREEHRREQERLEQIRLAEIVAGGGEFPTLPGAASTQPSKQHNPAPDAQRVMSLNPRTGHATIQTFQRPTPPATPTSKPPKAPSADEIAEKERLKPVRLPPDEVDYVKYAKVNDDRPWMNLRVGAAFTYIPPKSSTPPPAESTSDKQKGKGDGPIQRYVPGSGQLRET